MNEKKWLITTFDKKILGPISREKLIRLLRDNKLSESDEICPGNHFWIYVKEKLILSDLLEAPEILGKSERVEEEVVLGVEEEKKKP